MNNLLVMIALIAVMAIPGPVSAQTGRSDDAVEITSYGNINWTAGEVTATGIGAPPSAQVNPAQARAMTERAAYVVAIRNLLETIKGVQVDSVSVVENYMVKSDVIKTRVEGIVKGARVVNRRYMSDGSVEIQVSMPMKGAFLNVIVPDTFGKLSGEVIPVKPAPVPPRPPDVKPAPEPAQPAKPAVPPVVATPEKKPEPTQPSPATPTSENGPTMAFKGGTATGVVLDGRGLGLRPALLPRIIDTQGQEVYVGQIVTRTNFRVTDNPAVIKGVQASGSARTDVIVSQADAQMLRQLSAKGDFLQYCRVIIVY